MARDKKDKSSKTPDAATLKWRDDLLNAVSGIDGIKIETPADRRAPDRKSASTDIVN
jgi:hypothetical protein